VDVDPGVKFIAHTLFETQKIGVFLKDQDDNIKISLSYNYLYRENFSPIDLSKLAKYFGGGGHPRASGITISKDKIDDALKDIIKVLDKVDWQPKYKKS
jgi:nanoRNase/pAp phosphatase (c-di-AMP/oligoRNAs hydrolase)